MLPKSSTIPLTIALLVSVSGAEPPREPNTWQKLDTAAVTGRRYETPLAYAPELKRFLILGGRTSWAEYKTPRSFDVLALDFAENRWENWFPDGKQWGPKYGPCTAPAWKDEHWHFKDAEGNTRPNWTVYGTFSLGHAYDYDPDTRSFLFFANGSTFRFDPATRIWTDLKPATNPQTALGGVLLWSALCYDRHNKQFVLFGGGNVQSERGDPGTWIYTPADNAWVQLKLDKQPPQRANSQLVYDPVARKVVLFGGDQLDQLLADTWTFDVVKRQWEEVVPRRCPTPRAGHALLWLPRAKKVLLLGGYGYASEVGYVGSFYRRLPVEAWTFDTASGKWELVKRFESKTAPDGPANGFLHAAVDETDTVVVQANAAWVCSFDAARTDAAGTDRFGGKPGDVERRTGPYDPEWFRQDVPPTDADAVQAVLGALPANRWVQRPTPKLPRPNMDWGSAVFAPDQDLILRYSGGHSAYSGTAPLVYDVKTDRYSIPFAPEQPLEYVGSNDQVHGEWSFKGNPWMTGHTYKATGYDARLKCLVFAAHEYTYFFDPKTGKWSRNAERSPFRPNMYMVTLCDTPHGLVAWADKRQGDAAGLWRLDAVTRTWKPLPLTGTLPAKSPDRHGTAYDTKRDRLLFFSAVDKNKGDVTAYDFKTARAELQGAAGKDKAVVSARETIYLPELDAVLIGAHVSGPDGKPLWPLYDCAKNAWFGIDFGGVDPVGKGAFNNSIGLMYDPNRKLVWAVGQNSHVHVVRVDMGTAEVKELK
jgi:hypothetical protein